MRKITTLIPVSSILFGALLFTSSAQASEIEITNVDENVITVTGAKNSDELLDKYDEKSRLEGLEQYESLKVEGTDSDLLSTDSLITPFASSDDYKFDSVTKTNGKAKNYSTLGGYNYLSGLTLYWTGVHGGSSVSWTGSGTAKFIQINHAVTFEGSVLTIGAPPSFSTNNNRSTYTGQLKENTNSHMSQFSGLSAQSKIYLGDAIHESEGYVRGSDSQDYRPFSVVRLDG